MIVRRVRGSSMVPTLQPGQVVVGFRRRVRVGDIVVVRHDGRDIVKRVTKLNGSGVYVTGDNSFDSTDSRHYGFLNKSAILGTIMVVLPKPVNPPKPLKPRAVLLGRVLAAMVVLLTLLQLVRIDRVAVLFDDILPGNEVFAGFAVSLIMISQVFSVPFLLRIKLSPLGHVVSGALVALAPLWWLLVHIWSFGLVESTGQLGGFVDVPSNVFTVSWTLAWLVVSYYTIYLLGYNNLSVRPKTKKKKTK